MTGMRDDYARLDAVLDAARAAALDFHDGLEARPVAARDVSGAPGPAALPEAGIGALAALESFRAEVMPKLSASVGPRYLGFVTGGTTPAALAGDWLAAAVDNNVAMPGDSIATGLTVQALNYLLDLFELPREVFDGCFTTGATASNLLALTTAREWCGEALGLAVAEDGAGVLPKIPVLGACPHASMIKVLGIAGFGRNCVIPVARLAGGEAMDPAALAAKLAALPAGPKIVIASAGTVTGTDFDDLDAVADACRAHGAWLHVDGAFGIFARCVPELAPLAAGLERADSITGDGHKWLNVPYENGFFFTRHVALLERAHGVAAAYLSVESEQPAFMRRGVESSQRFRALPVWMTLLAYGREGYREMVRANCRVADSLGAWIDAADGYELLAPVRLNVVVFRGRFAGDEAASAAQNRDLLGRINAGGKLFCSPGAWDGKAGIRIAVSNWMTSEADLPIVTGALAAAREAE